MGRETRQVKKTDDDVMPENFDVNAFFQFMVNLEKFGSRILDAWSVKLTCSLVVTFHLTNIENRTKKSLTQLIRLLLGLKVLHLTKTADYL